MGIFELASKGYCSTLKNPMKKRFSRSEDALFIAALAIIMLGVGLLLVTTKVYLGSVAVWSFIVFAVGGTLLYLYFVRKLSTYFLFGGLLFIFEGVLAIVLTLRGMPFYEGWPIGMVAAGIAGLISTPRKRGKSRNAQLVPSVAFVCLGLAFTAFSYKFLGMSLSAFIRIWWPSFIVAAGIGLFVAFGITSSRIKKERLGSKKPNRKTVAKSGDSPSAP